MNACHIPHFRVIILTLLACSATSVLAQSDLPPLPPGASYTENGFLTVSAGGGFQPDVSGPPTPPGGGGSQGGGSGGWGSEPPQPDYAKGFYLSIAPGAESNSVELTFHNATNGMFDILEVATNLLGPWYVSQGFLATNVSPNSNMLAQPIAIEAYESLYDYEALYFRGLQVTPGQLRWKVPLTDPATSTNTDYFGAGLDAAPALSPDGQTIYMTTPNRTISAIDAPTGMIVWTDIIFTQPTNYTPQPAEWTGSAAVTASNVYVGGCDGNLYCLNATNGHTNWIKNMGTGSAVYGTPSIDTTGRILVPTDESVAGSEPVTGVTCLVPTSTNATVAWFFQPQDLHDNPDDPSSFEGGDVESSVAVANNGTIYFVAESWRLYSLDPTGKLNWFLPIQANPEKGAPDVSVAIDSFGRVLTGCNSEYIYCVNSDGSLEWTIPGGSPPINDYGPMVCSPTIGTNDATYTGTGISGDLLSIDPNGGLNWFLTSGTGEPTISSPAIGETALYFGSTTGEFFAVTLTNHAVAWTYTNTNAIYSNPLICPDGSVVYGCEDGYLYCFWGSSLPAGTNAPWPTFHQNNQRTGLQPGTTTLVENCGAPFLFDGTNNQEGTFTFNIIGTTNNSWAVYYSANLSNWTKLFTTNVTLSGTPATNIIIDDTVLNVPQRFYQLSNSTCCSRAIGFTRLTLTPGTNLIADQLCQVDDDVMKAFDTDPIPTLGFTMNDLNALFDLNPWATNTDGSAIFEWNGNGFDGDTNFANSVEPPVWLGGGNMTLLPGSSVIISNGLGRSYQIWFTGLVRNQQIFSLEAGTSYLSATAPIGGAITSITGYIPTNGDVVKLWNTSTSNFVSHTYTSSSWGTNGIPMLNVGEGFVLISTIARIWTNTWETGVCGTP